MIRMSYIRTCGIAIFLAAASLAFSQLTVSGDVASPMVLQAGDLAKMLRSTVTIDDPGGSKVEYEGVALGAILERAGVPSGKQLRGKALASYVLAKAQDGYQVVFGLAEIAPEFGNLSIIVADKRAGKPLSGKEGQFRLLCPNDKAGARSVRMLEAIEVVQLRK